MRAEHSEMKFHDFLNKTKKYTFHTSSMKKMERQDRQVKLKPPLRLQKQLKLSHADQILQIFVVENYDITLCPRYRDTC